MGYTVILWSFFQSESTNAFPSGYASDRALVSPEDKTAGGIGGNPPFPHKKARHLQRQTASFLYRGVRISMMVFRI